MIDIQAQNPFFIAYKTPQGTPPFELIKNEHFEPAFLKGIEDNQAEIGRAHV